MNLDDARRFAAKLAALEDANLRPEGQAIVLLARALDEAEAEVSAVRTAADGEADRLCTDADALGCTTGKGQKCNHCILYSRAATLVVPVGTEASTR